jgi:hypothetical protein
MTDEQKAALDLAILNLKTHGDDQLLSAAQPLIEFYESRVLAERKPVAWMDGIVHLYFDREMLDEEKTSGDFTPLFAHPTPDDANVSVATLFEVLMQQNIVTSDESYLSLRCVGVPPTEEEFVQAVRRTIDAAIDRARQSGEEA